MANAQANDPMEPMGRNDPTLPTDRIEFFDPIHRIESADRIEHQSPRLVTNEDEGARQRQQSSGSLRRKRGGSGQRRRRSSGITAAILRVLLQAPASSTRSLGRQRTRCQTGHGDGRRPSRAL